MTPQFIILRAVADYYDLDPQDLLGPVKTRKLSKPRQMCYVLFRDLTDMTTSEIGEFFERDHSTIIKGIGAFEERWDHTEQLAKDSIRNHLMETYA